MGSRPKPDRPDKPVIPVLVLGWNNAVSDSRFGPNLLEGVRIDWTSRAPGAVLYRQGALGIMRDSGKLPVLPALPGCPSTSPGTPGVVTGENNYPTKRTGF